VLLKEDYKAAEVAVLPVVDGFVQLLAVDRGTYLLRLTLYNLPAFTESLRRALRSVLLTSDARLAKALTGDWKKIERIRKLRNDYGVAHYDLEDKSEQLRRELTTAAEVIKKVITRYIANIKSKEPSEAG
jgi:hypothetical protein